MPHFHLSLPYSGPARTGCLLAKLLLWLALGLPAVAGAQTSAPRIDQGIQLGLVAPDQVLVWSRSDRPARLMAAYADNRKMRRARTVELGQAREDNDFTARGVLEQLPPGRHIWLKVWFQDLDDATLKSAEISGRFRTVAANGDIRFVWGADTGGQGFGINPAFGGYKIYEAMRRRQPQFFIQSGDSIYADNPIRASQTNESGAVWNNLTTPPEVAKAAESLHEFRARYLYNLQDGNLARFNREVPQIWQWDDHEVTNNWSVSKKLNPGDYPSINDVQQLLPPASKAFQEYAPLPAAPDGQGVIYRKISFGPLLEVFVLDMRSYRGGNNANLQNVAGPETAYLGERQVAWLEQQLAQSTALWKVIAADQPLGLCLGDEGGRFEGIANCDNGPAAGRELELAGLLQFIKRQHIVNLVWLTGDVHYAAAHFYNPEHAASPDFSPFWEFVAGPLNAGTFGPAPVDRTFGLEVPFCKSRGHYLDFPGSRSADFCQNPPPPPPDKNIALSPAAGYQFFGEVNIASRSKRLTVVLRDIHGAKVYNKTLAAE